jgi:hypothetical protein
MNYICTWFCADDVGSESVFPQTGQKSSSKSHQNIYWRCVMLFFLTSRRFNKNEKHLFFTNVKSIPQVDGIDVEACLQQMEVEVIFTDFKYKTPKGYFDMFQNQFYEFSILEYITNSNKNNEDTYMILDSDCIFLKSACQLFDDSISNGGFLSFEDDCTTELVIHGLSRIDRKLLYQELLNTKIDEIPGYHLGEFFLASVKNINIIFNDFLKLWPELKLRFKAGLPKFNEEAQTLSFIYFKNGFKASPSRKLLKRIWTNPVFYRNVEETDAELVIWHLPSEKMYGLADLYKNLFFKQAGYGQQLSNDKYKELATGLLGIPRLPLTMWFKYYYLSHYRALQKRVKKLAINISANKLQKV